MNNFISNLSQDQTKQQNSFTLVGNTWNAHTTDNKQSSNTVLSNALQGEFDFSFFSMDFSISNSISNQDLPGELEMYTNIKSAQPGFTTPTLEAPNQASPVELLNAVVFNDAPNVRRISRIRTLQRDVTEQAQEAMLNFNVPFSISEGFSGNIKLGGKYVRNSRDNDETQRYTSPNTDQYGIEFLNLVIDESLWPELGLETEDLDMGIRAELFEDADYDVGDFLSGESLDNDFYFKGDVSKMSHYAELAKENDYYRYALRESAQYDYNYERNLIAFYTSAELNVGKYVTLFPGIRYESYQIDYNANFTERYGPYPGEFREEALHDDSNKDVNWFPQLHIRVKPTDWLDIRAASTKSIIYPDYRAVSPYMYYDSYVTPINLRLGNTSLKPAMAQNYDIYASVFQNKIGLFTAGVFYKEIDNLIVTSSFRTKDSETINNRFELQQTSQTVITTWDNLDATSTVRGFELDYQTHFWYLPSFLKGLVLNVNYTHITSETSYPYQTSVKVGEGPFAKTVFVDSARSGRMPHQPGDIFNVTLGYDIGGFSARLSFSYTDDVLRGVNRTYKELDSYTDSYKRWDFTAQQKLPWLGGGLQLYLNLNNITNTVDRTFTSELGKLASVEYYGRTVDLGLRYTFHQKPEYL